MLAAAAVPAQTWTALLAVQLDVMHLPTRLGTRWCADQQHMHAHCGQVSKLFWTARCRRTRMRAWLWFGLNGHVLLAGARLDIADAFVRAPQSDSANWATSRKARPADVNPHAERFDIFDGRFVTQWDTPLATDYIATLLTAGPSPAPHPCRCTSAAALQACCHQHPTCHGLMPRAYALACS